MNNLPNRALRVLAPVLVFAAVTACGAGAPDAAEPGMMAAGAHDHGGLEASGGSGFTAADVRFMQMMIVHHAQALEMTEMAPTHGAGDDLLRLARKIEISQHDEIALMERWLEDREQPAPEASHMESMSMPGLLTEEQLEELDAARDSEFDRLFLEFMIEHHLGAVQMVDELFETSGAAQDPDIFRFATDVGADQMDEIGVMDRMLDDLDDMDDPNPPE